METKEEALVRIKSQMAWLGWDDEQCLAFYNQKDNVDVDTEEISPIHFAYYTQDENSGKREYKIVPDVVFEEKNIQSLAFDYKRCFNKKQAEDCVTSWKDEAKRELDWHRYMNT
jgi:hypothetical protein